MAIIGSSGAGKSTLLDLLLGFRDPQSGRITLDSVTEQAFQQALAHFTRDHTVIIVAHRLSTIQRVDHILVLHQGKLAEQGDFSSLLARNGLFARMHELQSFGQAAECGGVSAD